MHAVQRERSQMISMKKMYKKERRKSKMCIKTGEMKGQGGYKSPGGKFGRKN